MSSDVEDFFGLVTGRVQNCPDVILRQAVVAAADEFCRRTRLLVDEQTINVAANNRFVTLSPSNGEVFVVEQVRRQEQPLAPSSRADFERDRLDVRTGTPIAFYVEGDRRLVLGPIPTFSEALIVRYAARFEPDARELPERLYLDWRQAIAAGARAYVRRHHGGPWDNPQEELSDRQLFEQEIARANVDRGQGGTRKAVRTRGTYF